MMNSAATTNEPPPRRTGPRFTRWNAGAAGKARKSRRPSRTAARFVAPRSKSSGATVNPTTRRAPRKIHERPAARGRR